MSGPQVAEIEARCKRKADEDDDETIVAAKALGTADAYARLSRLRYGQDYDRVLYSSAFRRLDGVTQVVASNEIPLFHNRLTHSLKVAQTGGLIVRSILEQDENQHAVAEIITLHGGLNPRVVRVACLAHDLGHPPFGHIGEEALQDIVDRPHELLRDYPESAGPLKDGFEGNAQSFRIVTRLAFRQASKTGDNVGLNLTRATLAALSKYPWSRSDGRSKKVGKQKWGAYDDDYPTLQWALEGIETRDVNFHGQERRESRSIEAQVMDWADDIAYAVHDIEDFFRAGLIPLHVLAEGGQETKAFASYALGRIYNRLEGIRVDKGTDKGELLDPNKIRDYFARALNDFPKQGFIGSVGNRAALHTFASAIIKRATRDVRLVKGGLVLPDVESYVIIEMLKQLTGFYVIDRASLSSAQRGQQQILVSLVQELWQWLRDFSQKDVPSYVLNAAELSSDDGAKERTEEAYRQDWRYRNLPPRLVDFVAAARGGASAVEPDDDDVAQDMLARIQLRGVIDYVSSLSETQTIELHERLSRGWGSSMIDPWLTL
ncbi:deoxyguanosinetriphosphate triphosphohydrolase family protein [Kribbella qitaiheensis]|uniref:deoxyguanosinetriphosphate triphosphohydrolase family protein n=1 Tax=Kribbella qitaiheensis TaxID=1544730 RepID=UPI00360A04B6